MAKQQNRWRELLELVECDDGLKTFDAGAWTGDKLWWCNRYIEITTTALVGSPKWAGGLTYVDLFGGPGVSRSKDSGERFPGSPIIAARAPKPFSRVLICEADRTAADDCRSRMERWSAQSNFEVFQGDCNVEINNIVEHIPDESLTLGFIDPRGLHADFATIETLATGRAVDLLILVADKMDAVRNIETYAAQELSNLDRVLGEDSNWREDFAALQTYSSANLSSLILAVYERQLRNRLNYRVFESTILYQRKGIGLYRLLFASRHELGLDFWRKSTEKSRRGDLSLFD